MTPDERKLLLMLARLVAHMGHFAGKEPQKMCKDIADQIKVLEGQ